MSGVDWYSDTRLSCLSLGEVDWYTEILDPCDMYPDWYDIGSAYVSSGTMLMTYGDMAGLRRSTGLLEWLLGPLVRRSTGLLGDSLGLHSQGRTIRGRTGEVDVSILTGTTSCLTSLGDMILGAN